MSETEGREPWAGRPGEPYFGPLPQQEPHQASQPSAQPVLSQPAPAHSPRASRRSRPSAGKRAVRAIGWTFAAAGVAALAGLSGYLWLTHEEWSEQNETLRAEATSLGEEVAVARAEADANQAALAETESQLAEAKATISSLADDDANAGDSLRYATHIIERMQECADERAELIGYLKEAERYTASSLRNAEREIDEYCADVAQSWADHLADNP